MRDYNKKTNSWYTENEIDVLESMGFSWDNHSNSNEEGYDTHYSVTEETYILVECTREGKFIVDHRKFKLFNDFSEHSRFDHFYEVIDYIKKNNKKDLLLTSLVSFSSIFIALFFLIITPFLYFNANEEERKEFKLFKTLNNKFNPMKLTHYKLHDYRVPSFIVITILICLTIGFFIGKGV